MNAPSNMHTSLPPRIAVLVPLLAVLFLVAGSDSDARPKAALASREVQIGGNMPVAEPVDQDTEYRALAVGTWEDEYKGKRTMHLLADGTGTMVVELSGLTARLFASRLEFDMVWSIEEGRMKKQTVGGRPEAKVRAILSMMGNRVDEPILELSQRRLLLLDADGKTRYDWRRVKGE